MPPDPVTLNMCQGAITVQKGMIKVQELISVPALKTFAPTSMNGYRVTTDQVEGKVSQFRPWMRIVKSNTNNSTRTIKPRNANIPVLNSMGYRFTISKGDESRNVYCSVFNSGRISIKTGLIGVKYYDNEKMRDQLEAIRFHLAKFMTPIVATRIKNSSARVVTNNVTGSTRAKFGINLAKVSTLSVLQTPGKYVRQGFTVARSEYEPEIFPSLILQVVNADTKTKAFKLIISMSGAIQIVGVRNISRYGDINKFIQDMVSDLAKTKDVKRATSSPPKTAPKPKARSKGSTCPVARRPCAGGKCPTKGMYVKPNPQKQPCCYKVPKKVTAGTRRTVTKAYNDAGVAMPASVKKTFGIKNTATPPASSPANRNINLNMGVGKGGRPIIRIGGRECSRYTKAQLVKIASDLGIVLPTKVTKMVICEKIQTEKFDTLNVLNKAMVNVGNRKYSASIRDGKLRFAWDVAGKSRSQACATLPKATVVALAKAFKIDDAERMSRPQMCAAMEEVVVEKIIKSPTPVRTRTPTPSRSPTNNNMNNLRKMLNKNNNNNNNNSGWNELEMMLNSPAKSASPVRRAPGPSVMNRAIRNRMGNNYNKLNKSVVPNYEKRFGVMSNGGMGNVEIKNKLMNQFSENKRVTNLEREKNRVVSREVLNNGTVVEVVKRANGQEVTIETI
jgi:TATA-box binding protein (TBP) (component of TFIID and TFIIIB)